MCMKNRIAQDRAQEAHLFHQAQHGCRASLNRLMAEHERLVQVNVRRQWPGQVPFEERVQAGRIGLWRAILGYQPERGLAFSTYAWPTEGQPGDLAGGPGSGVPAGGRAASG